MLVLLPISMDSNMDIIYKSQREVSILKEVLELLSWDENTNMPEKALIGRSEQSELIRGLIHDRMMSDSLRSSLNNINVGDLNKNDLKVVDELKKQVERLSKTPKEFTQNLQRHIIVSQGSWRNARKSNDYSIFYPDFNKMVLLKRQQAKLINPNLNPYEVLVNEYEEGMDEQRLDELFIYLKNEIFQLFDEIKKSRLYRNQKKKSLHLNSKPHKKLVKDFVSQLGLQRKKISLSTSIHPFSTQISKNDVRITGRYKGKVETFFDFVHEAGHALYDSNLPKKYYGTVLYSTASLGLHESQSTFWENMICKNKTFWEGYYPRYKQVLKTDMSLTDFYRQINMVRATSVRLDADELTYPLHIILRYEIEKDLINNVIHPLDAKRIWREKTNELLCIKSSKDNKGVLQDIHWACGDFGYFPIYVVGLIYATQIYNKISTDIPSFKQDLYDGDFKKIIEWLNTNIHSKGKTMTADEIIKKACGKNLDPKQYVQYLRQKYTKIYELE